MPHAGMVGRNRILLHPSAHRKFIKISARRNRAVEICGIETMDGGILSRSAAARTTAPAPSAEPNAAQSPAGSTVEILAPFGPLESIVCDAKPSGNANIISAAKVALMRSIIDLPRPSVVTALLFCVARISVSISARRYLPRFKRSCACVQTSAFFLYLPLPS